MNEQNYTDPRMIILEGFDMVGKNTIASVIKPDVLVYTPNHTITDLTVGRDNSWVIGTSMLDFIAQIPPSTPFILNRGIASNYVYTKLAGKELNEEILKYWFSTYKFHYESIIYHVSHSSKESAKGIYSNAIDMRTKSNELDKLDKFSSFDEYWNQYLKAEELYNKFYDEVIPKEIPVIHMTSKFIPNEYNS